MSGGVTNVPEKLKSVQHYMKTAKEHDTRNPIVSYYCQLYGMQKAMEIDSKSPECRAFLMEVMTKLEQMKKELKDKEEIQNPVIGQAFIEHYALQLFLYADNEDRQGRHGKNVVKSFYTAGIVMDVLMNFGDLSEDIEANRKYAKWKAAYIHNCLKEGITPVPGPLSEEGTEQSVAETEQDVAGEPANIPPAASFTNEAAYPNVPPASSMTPSAASSSTSSGYSGGLQQVPQASASSGPIASAQWQPPSANTGGVALGPAEYQKAQKFCKFANSALQYEDAQTAIENLTKALKVLTTGQS